MTEPSLHDRLRVTLRAPGSVEERLQGAVEEIRAGFEAQTCTLHEAEPGSRRLRLRAHLGLPENVIARVRTIEFGKGMAGICAERREPVTVCNLQTDNSGVARPAARETRVSGAVVVPILRDGEVIGTLGVGRSRDHDYTQEEIDHLKGCGEMLLEVVHQQ